MPDEKKTEKMVPVLVGFNHHVMGRATIEQKAPDGPTPEKVTITVEVTGPDARILGDFVASGELVGLSFAGIPVTPHIPRTPTQHKEKK